MTRETDVRMTRLPRRLAKAIYLGFLFLTGLLRWARSQVAKRGVVVLTLHRVLPDEQYAAARLEPGMAVRASTFQRFLQYIDQNCKPLLPGETISASGEAARRPRVILTFDDGWKDNFETALPVAQKYQVPFTVFVCPQMMASQESYWTTKVNNLWWAAQEAGKLDLVHNLVEGRANGTASSLIENLKHV